VGFPGILKGALLVKARKITDEMAIAAAHSIANFSEKRGIHTENIIANMNETEVFPHEAADVAMQAIKDGVARTKMTWQEAYDKAYHDIMHTRKITSFMQEHKLIEEPPAKILQESLETAIRKVRL
jgi:malate dehydrogenase (oxaloacetate-decarboxylating)